MLEEELKDKDQDEDQDKDEMSVEEIFARLEEIAEKLQDSSSSLETAFKEYQEGMRLIRECGEKIDLIEKKVQILGGEETLSEVY